MADLSIPEQFCDYVLKNSNDDIRHILEKDEKLLHYSLIVNFTILFEENVHLGQLIASDSEKTLPLCDEGLILAQNKFLDSLHQDEKEDLTIKHRVHVRIIGLPINSLAIRNDDRGELTGISGTVVKATIPKVLIWQQDYACSKCKTSQTVFASFHQFNAILPPKICPNLCTNATFKLVKKNENETSEFYMDYQEIKVQEEVGKLSVGSMPCSIWVALEHDLVDACHPGDHVTVWGTATRRWRKLHVDVRSEAEIVIRANNIIVTNDQRSIRLLTEDTKTKFRRFWESYKGRELFGRDHILASFCPQVYGLYLVKLAMCIVLCGGLQSREESGSRARSESHLLLVGDPGTGKSHLLRFAAKISPRSVLTTGVGTTSAGLTVTAVREGSDWHLEAGALVLADGGVCCIDELSSMREHDRASIHEAMEQQTISVAKAGIVTKLNSRCSILAATNPKGKYNPDESLTINVALASPLLSRFDLVLILQDSRNEDWDRLVSSYILEMSALPNLSDTKNENNDVWSIEMLQNYFAIARTYQPILSSSALAALSRYYQEQRSADNMNQARTTVRMLESLVRLSQGHAKLMMQDEVTLLDAIASISLMECSMMGSALIGSCNALHASFPENPHDQYLKQAELVLRRLNLEDLLSELDSIPCETNLSQAPKPQMSSTCENNVKPSADFTQCLNNILADVHKQKSTNISQLNKKATKVDVGVGRSTKINSKLFEQNKIAGGKKSCAANEEAEDRISQNANVERVGISKGIEKNKGKGSEDNKKSLASKNSERIDDLSAECETVNASKRKRVDYSSDGGGDIFADCIFNKPAKTKPVQLGTNTLEKLKAFSKPETSDNGESASKSDSCFEDSLSEENLFATPVHVLKDSDVGSELSEEIPSSLITQPVILAPESSKDKRVDSVNRDKFKALARLGKTLSQISQSSQKPLSQFSLHEMSWDDIDLEI